MFTMWGTVSTILAACVAYMAVIHSQTLRT